MATDTEVILLALQKERNGLHERILQVDRIISRVKSIEYGGNSAGDSSNVALTVQPIAGEEAKPVTWPTTADIKIQVLRVFDSLGYAASLNQLQEEYTRLSGSTYKIREAVRSLYNVGILKMIKYKNAARGFLWVKTEWIKDSQLQDKYKPLGFDLLHKPDNLIFQ